MRNLRRPTRKPTGPRTTRWWTTVPDSTWNEVRDAVVGTWNARPDGGILDASVASDAMAFGHAARSAYPQAHEWGSELLATLRVDWDELEPDVAHRWDRVHGAIRHGWETAGADRTRMATRATPTPHLRDLRPR